MKKILLLCSTILLAPPALADNFTYAPEHCEFQTTFPERPLIEKKCSPQKNGKGDSCAEIVTFTKAAGSDSSTNFRITCQSITDEEYKKYTPPILEETLKQMLREKGLEAFNSQSSEKGKYRTATTLSLSERDAKSLVYSSQIWVGEKSMFTIESEMLGQRNEMVEKVFADILRNTYPKDTPPDKINREPAPPAKKEGKQ